MIARTLAPFLLCLVPGACNGSDARQQAPLERLPREVGRAEQELAAASIEFGLNLLREVRARSKEPNVLVSPLSASLALGMALNGARGETFDALRDGLALPDAPLGELNEGYRNLARLIGELDGGVELAIANALFPERSFSLLPEYVERTRSAFDAELRPLDFAAPGAVEEINAWVKEMTRGHIPRLLEDIAADEVLFLVNAVFFRGSWTEPFDPERTHPQPFRRADGTTVEVPMMNRKEEPTVRFSDDEVELVELPYGRGAFAMVLVVPRGERSLADLIAGLDAAKWARWMGGLGRSALVVSLPRFEVEFGASLTDSLKALGMARAFGVGGADFGAMAEPGALGKLYLSRVDQRVFLEVDERGTTAAAATSVGVGLVSMPPEFRADRPFLLAIRERFSGTLLFLGAIGDPSQP